jgi:myosin-5
LNGQVLQQQFNQFVFEAEQAEYAREKIIWSFVSFPDNKKCIEMIESRTNGLLALLDEQVPPSSPSLLPLVSYPRPMQRPF